jgi:3-oxoacyl-[acyl-carrier protein] reductase
MRHLTGRTAIITGGSRGLGPHIARALAREGMNLVLAARSEGALETRAAELRKEGVRAIGVPTDVSSQKALEALASVAAAEFETLDVLVNNAGVMTAYPYEKLAIEDIERVIRVNLTSAMILTRLVLPGMLERRRGHIVNLSLIDRGPLGSAVRRAVRRHQGGPDRILGVAAHGIR